MNTNTTELSLNEMEKAAGGGQITKFYNPYPTLGARRKGEAGTEQDKD